MPRWKGPFERTVRRLGRVVLLVAILLVFGSVAQHDQRQVALEATSQSRSPPPIAEPYPGPYPPPASPMPTPIPTAVPTPMPTLPIAPNLGIIWAETTRITTEAGSNQPGPITFWRSNIADLASRASLLTIPQGNTLKNASLSPDGSKIAFTLLPPDSGSRWWLHGTLWVMNVDGSGLRELALDIFPGGWRGPYPLWSPDSRTVAYIKSVPKVPPPTDKETEPEVQEIHVLDTTSGENKLLVADDLITRMLGWSQRGESLFYERSAPGVGYELWAVATNIKMSPQRMLLLPEHYAFSPDGTRLLIYDAEEGFIVLSVDGKSRKALVPPDQAFGGIWSVDGTELIGRQGWGGQFRALDVNTAATRMLVAAPLKESNDTLLSASPDKQWILIQSQSYGDLYLLQVGSTLRIDVPGMGSMSFVGWTSHTVALPS